MLSVFLADLGFVYIGDKIQMMLNDETVLTVMAHTPVGYHVDWNGGESMWLNSFELQEFCVMMK
jgi:hypothetical protein